MLARVDGVAYCDAPRFESGARLKLCRREGDEAITDSGPDFASTAT